MSRARKLQHITVLDSSQTLDSSTLATHP